MSEEIMNPTTDDEEDWESDFAESSPEAEFKAGDRILLPMEILTLDVSKGVYVTQHELGDMSLCSELPFYAKPILDTRKEADNA